MIPAPAHLLAAAGTAHAPRWRVELVRDGQPAVVLPVLDGTISKAWDRSPRERCSIRVPVAGAADLLDQGLLPTGALLRVHWSVWPWPDELLLHEGELLRSRLDRSQSVWLLESADRSAVIAADLLDQLAYDPPAGQTVAQFAAWIVQRTYPGCPVLATPAASTVPVPDDLKVTGDPWAAAVSAAAAAGCEILMHPGPWCELRPAAAPGEPVDLLDSAISVTSYELDHQRGHSGVQMIYEDRDQKTEVVGRWWDTRPASPSSTARIGRVPYRETSQGHPTQPQADAAAAALAPLAAGRARAAAIRHIARPWLEPGDTIAVRYAGGPAETALVAAVEIPIGPPNVQITTPRNSGYTLEAA